MREDQARKWTAKRAANKSGAAGPMGPQGAKLAYDGPHHPLTAEDINRGFEWPLPTGSAGMKGPQGAKLAYDGPHHPLTAEDINRGFEWPLPTGNAGMMGPMGSQGSYAYNDPYYLMMHIQEAQRRYEAQQRFLQS